MNEQTTINCVYIREQMHFLNDAACTADTRRELEGHLQACRECAVEWQQLQDLRRLLAKVKVEPMRPAFVEDAFVRIREQQSRTLPLVKPALGLAAGILLVGALYILNKPVSGGENYDLLVKAPIQARHSRDVRIAFNSPGLLENVGIEIVLPDSLSLSGSDVRTLSWQTDLRKGKNELRLPLVSTPDNPDIDEAGFLLARLTHGDKVREFRVRVVRGEQV